MHVAISLIGIARIVVLFGMLRAGGSTADRAFRDHGAHERDGIPSREATPAGASSAVSLVVQDRNRRAIAMHWQEVGTAM